MGGMAGVGVAPPPNHPPTSLAGGSTRARHPGPSIARARCGGKLYPGCLSVPLPPKSPDFHPRQAPPNRPVPHRQVRRCSGKAHSRARTAAAAALARSLDRASERGTGTYHPHHHPRACVRADLPARSRPDLRDVPRLARARPPRVTELTAQQRTWTGRDGGRGGAPSLQLQDFRSPIHHEFETITLHYVDILVKELQCVTKLLHAHA